MGYKNFKELFIDAPKLLTAIEEKLPAGAPVISTKLKEAAAKGPDLPDFPAEVPVLPAPQLPDFTPPGGGEAGLTRYVKGAEVKKTGATVTNAKAVDVNLSSPKSNLVFE